MRRLAKLMKLDPSAVSLMLRGRRMMTAHEANKISGLLTIPVTEVLRQAGVSIDDNMRQVALKAMIDQHSRLAPIVTKNPRRLSAPDNVPTNGLAAQVRAPKSVFDGWVIFAGAFDNRVVALIDRLCVIEMVANTGGAIVGTLLRGYESDRFNVVPFVGNSLADFEGIAVKSVAPVLWIRPV